MAFTELSLRRQEEIEAALLELMHSIPYQQITVTDLTKQLGIARKSFYYYFPSKEACFESLADRLIQESALYVTRNLTDEQKKDLAEAYKVNQGTHTIKPIDIFENLTPSQWLINGELVEYDW